MGVHIDALLNVLTPRAGTLRRYADDGYICSFSVGCFLEAWNRSTVLPPNTLAAIGAVGASLWLDIYATAADDELS